MDTYKSKQLVQVAQNLYRDGNGKYHARIMYKGKAHKKSLKTSDRETANRNLRDYEKSLAKQSVEKPDITFADASKLWLDSLYDLKHHSKRRRESSMKMLLPHFKHRKLRTITKQELSEWAATRAKEVTERTFNIDRETLILLFEYAKKTLGIIETNHAKDLAKMKVKKAKVVPPTREEFAQLVEYLDNSKRLNKEVFSRNSAKFVRFLAYSGMRVEEARHVLWKHVNFETGKVLVTGNEEGTKNHSQRSIPLFPSLRELLEECPEDQRHANQPIFGIYSVQKLLMTASKAIGLPEGEYFGHHDMRHFFCTNAVENKVDDNVIANWLGHKDGGVLVKTTYGHLRQSFGDAEALKMTFKA